MAGACALARKRLTDFVSGLSQGGTAEKVGAGIKAGMIFGVSAPAKGLAGNASFAGLRMLAEQPLEAGVDYLLSLGRSAATGFKVPPHHFREVVNALDMDGLRAFGGGLGKGVATTVGGVKSGVRAVKRLAPGTPFADRIAAFVGEVSLHLSVNPLKNGINNPVTKIQSPAGRAFVQTAFAAVEAVDRPFFEGAFDVSLYMQAKLSAVRQGLKRADPRFEAEVQRLLRSPTDEMKARALDDAIYTTFKGKPAAAQMIERGRKFVQQLADEGETTAQRVGGAAASLAMDVTVPFTGVPTDIVSKAAARTPLGLVSPRMVGGVIDMAKGRAGGQAAVARAVAPAAIGSGMLYIGYQLAREGRLIGGPSSSSNERADNSATRADYSVKLGGQWVDLRTLGPVAIPLLVGADLARKQQKSPDSGAAEMLAAGAGSVGKAVVENSFAQGIKRTIEAAQDPENKAGALLAGAIPIPSILGQVTRAFDDTPREARGIGEKLMARTPLSVLLPAKGTPFGTAPSKSLLERVSPMTGFTVKQDRDTPEMQEVRRLGLSVGLPERTTSVRGQSVEIPREDYAKMLESQGERVLPAIRRLMDSPAYQAVPDEEKKRRLRITIDRQRDAARNPIRRNIAALLNGK